MYLRAGIIHVRILFVPLRRGDLCILTFNLRTRIYRRVHCGGFDVSFQYLPKNSIDRRIGDWHWLIRGADAAAIVRDEREPK